MAGKLGPIVEPIPGEVMAAASGLSVEAVLNIPDGLLLIADEGNPDLGLGVFPNGLAEVEAALGLLPNKDTPPGPVAGEVPEPEPEPGGSSVEDEEGGGVKREEDALGEGGGLKLLPPRVEVVVAKGEAEVTAFDAAPPPPPPPPPPKRPAGTGSLYLFSIFVISSCSRPRYFSRVVGMVASLSGMCLVYTAVK